MVLEVKNLSANAGDVRDMGLIPGSGRSSGGGYDNPLQYSCLANPMDRGAWWGTVHEVAQSQTWLKWLSTSAHTHTPFISSNSNGMELWWEGLGLDYTLRTVWNKFPGCQTIQQSQGGPLRSLGKRLLLLIADWEKGGECQIFQNQCQ